MRPEYSAWRFSFTILLYYSTVLTLSKNFHILSRFNVNEMGPHWVLFFYCTLSVVLSWPVTAETCSQISPNCNFCILFDVCCVLTVHKILYRFDNTQRDGVSQIDGNIPDSSIRVILTLINTDGQTDRTLSSARATIPSNNPAKGQEIFDSKPT